jgi:predicted AAA+ superfamily ATPase
VRQIHPGQATAGPAGRCRDPRSPGPGRSPRLQEPELFFEAHRHQLVCLDEIQLLPEFFSRLRAEIDRDRRPGRFLLLGSASGPLLRQSHESLAGRIAQLELTPILLKEERAQLIAPVEQAFEARPGIWVRPPP